MISTLLFAMAMAGASGPGSVLQGVTRTDGGLPIPDVSVVVDGGPSALTDSTGEFVLAPIGPGEHSLRFSKPGYRALMLSVLVIEGSSTRLDVTLAAQAVALDPVHVVSRRTADAGRAPASSTAAAEPGSWRATQSEVRESARLDHGDALRTLAASPAVQMQPESPTALHVRGGSGDENLVLLDGIPLENAVHAADVLTAVNPDAVKDVTLGGGATSARYGGRLSGVVNIRTLDPGMNVVRARGTLSPVTASGLVDLPLRGVGGGAILSFRQSYGDVFPALTSAGPSDGASAPVWRDMLAKVTTRLGGGTLSALALTAHDRILFDARSGATTQSDAIVPIVGDVGADPTSDSPQNRFDWGTTAQGVAWNRPIAAGTFALRLWRSETAVGADWATVPGPVRLSSSLERAGGSAAATWQRGAGWLTAGIQLDRMRTEYAVSPAPGVESWHLAARPIVVAPFLERQWSLGTAWETTLGLRAPSMSGGAPQMEPRLSVTARTPGGIVASAGYARSHQHVQSLRNEESLLDAIIGVSLPVGAGADGVPVAHADALSASLAVPLAARTRLTFEGYTRWLGGLVLVAPATSEAFALSAFGTGSGRASGIGASVVHAGERLSWDATYALAAVSRTTQATSYQPAFAPRSSASLGVIYRATARTRVRLATWLASERRTTAVGDTITWEWQQSLARTRSVSGTPQRYAVPLGTSSLPGYARVDASVRQDIAVGAGAALTACAGVQNLFDARNAFAFSLGDQSGQQPLPMMPRSLSLGLEWRW